MLGDSQTAEYVVETGVADGEELSELCGVVGVCDDAVERALEVGFELEFFEEGA